MGKTGPNHLTPRCTAMKNDGTKCNGVNSYPVDPSGEVRCWHHNEHEVWIERREELKSRRNPQQRRLF